MSNPEILARVIRVDEGKAWIEPLDGAACAPCAGGAGCGLGRSTRRFGGAATVCIASCATVAPGDIVVVSAASRALVLAAAALFGMPLLGFLLGASVGPILIEYSPAGAETGALLGAGIGLLVGSGAARASGHRLASRASFQPQLVRKVVT